MMKIIFQLGAATVGLAVSSVSFAASIFTITPASTAVSVYTDSAVHITYTVTNNSGIDMSAMSYVASTASILSAGTTCERTLAKNASCTVVTSYTAPSTPGSLTLSLGVCGQNGNLCNRSPNVNVTVTSPPPTPVVLFQKAYFAIGGDFSTPNSVYKCSVGNTGTLSSCQRFTDSSSFIFYSQDIIVNSATTFAYVLNQGDSRIAVCHVSSTTGALSNCTSRTSSINVTSRS